jgi:hypothetical protein
MKTRKNISSLIVLLFLTLMLSTTVEAQRRPNHRRPAPKQIRHQVSRTQAKPAVGAPLDGGLLALLAGAGITYFAARKKKKKNMQE